jgi:hypothetical protein
MVTCPLGCAALLSSKTLKMKKTASSNMPLFIYDISGTTSEKAIFRETLALTALAALNTTGLLGYRTQHVRTSFGEEWFYVHTSRYVPWSAS